MSNHINIMYSVYIIQCDDNSLYAGVTSDIGRRLKEHKSAYGSWHTKLHKPIRVLYTEEYKTRLEALRREKQIKGWRREKKLNLIKFGKPILEG